MTMTLYNHAAIWDDHDHMPRSFFTNGYALLNNAPMSKSKGNFLTLSEGCDEYSADGTRIALADAGDTLGDGNFRTDNANAALLKLWNLGDFIEKYIGEGGLIDPATVDPSKYVESQDTFDAMFDNEINRLIISTEKYFEQMKFKMALKDGFHEPINVRDTYINMKKGELNPNMLLRFFHVQLLMLSPFAPHFCDYYWRKFFLTFSAKVPNHDTSLFKDTVIGSPWPQPYREYDK